MQFSSSRGFEQPLFPSTAWLTAVEFSRLTRAACIQIFCSSGYHPVVAASRTIPPNVSPRPTAKGSRLPPPLVTGGELPAKWLAAVLQGVFAAAAGSRLEVFLTCHQLIYHFV